MPASWTVGSYVTQKDESFEKLIELRFVVNTVARERFFLKHNVGGLIETDASFCVDCFQTHFWHNKVCYNDVNSPYHVKDEAQHCSVGKSETLGHTQEPFPPGFDTSCGEESGTSVRQISVVLYRTRLSSAPSASPAFIWRTSIAGSWKCQCSKITKKNCSLSPVYLSS